MAPVDRLPLARQVIRQTLDLLEPTDHVSIVTYASGAGVRLTPTEVSDRDTIVAAIDSLVSGGGTAGASGINLAYEQAALGFIEGGINHVVLCTDGDFNVGVSSTAELLELIREKRATGVTFTALGFGRGNLNDAMLESVSNAGNGFYGVISDETQAARYVSERMLSTLSLIARDVKVQVEFNPALVSAYRLLGYENRSLADEDFRDDVVDAGEIGAGHQVTALYEVELVTTIDKSYPLATVHVRHKAPKATKASEAVFAFEPTHLSSSFAAAPADLRFAFATAAFADVLRGAEDAEHWDLGEIKKIAAAAAGDDADRKELVGLIDQARALKSGSAALAK
jgi:Ca-activated chloride channel family protein